MNFRRVIFRRMVTSFQVTVNGATIDFDNVCVSPYYSESDGSRTSNDPITSITFADGLYQKFQSIQRHGSEDIIASTVLDYAGQVERAFPLFTDATSTSLSKYRPAAETLMKKYFSTQDYTRKYAPASKDIALKPDIGMFREDHGTTIIEQSPLGRVIKTLGRLADKSSDAEFEYTNDAEENAIPGEPLAQPHYMVTITKTSATGNYYPDGTTDVRITKEYVNPFGLLVKTVAKGEQENNDIISTREPDILDRNWKTTSPLGYMTADNPDDYTTTYTYNTLDQVVEKLDPDAGKVESLYDKLGNIRIFRDANKTSKDSILVDKYDAFSRLTEVYMVANAGTSKFTQANADNPNWPDNTVTDKRLVKKYEYDKAPAALPTGLTASDMKYLKGRLAASHAFASEGTVSKYFSYDYLGKLETSWLKIGSGDDMPLQQQTFIYNLSGQLILKKTKGAKPGNNATTSKEYVKYERYEYDELNRLKTVYSKEGDNVIPAVAFTKVAEFEYWPDGKVKYRNFGDECMQSVAFRYDPAERLEYMRHEKYDDANFQWSETNRYNQQLTYNAQGNICNILYNLPPEIGLENKYTRGFKYEYDHFNRLISADYGASRGTRLDMGEDKFDAKYNYDRDGAFITLARGPLANEDFGVHGLYHYNPGSHRVNSITNRVANNAKDRSAEDNYVYDDNGNVIKDKALMREIKYDYRNMPEKILQYTDNTFGTVKSYTTFLYDADGNRVAKFQRDVPQQ